MITYKDKTFCPYYILCKTWQHGNCNDAATPEIMKAAKKWTKTVTDKDTILISLYDTFPACYVRWWL